MTIPNTTSSSTTTFNEMDDPSFQTATVSRTASTATFNEMDDPSFQTATVARTSSVLMLPSDGVIPITVERTASVRIFTSGPGLLPITNPTKAISGIIYGPGDDPVADAVVILFRQADDVYVAQSTTDAGGAYSFPRDETDTAEYYVLSYKPNAIPQIHGMSDRGLVPV